jgi:dTMP kinase
MGGPPSVPTRSSGKFIVLDGIDGSGKSTISKGIADRLHDPSLVYKRYKEIATTSPALETSMRQLESILWPPTQEHLRQLPSRYRVLLHGAWVNLVTDAVIKPLIALGKTLLYDGWYYKIMARFVVDGYSEDYIRQIFYGALEPDYAIILQPEVELVWSRGIQNGRRFSPVEMGLYQGHAALGKDTFIHYQSRTQEVILDLARVSGTKVIIVDSNRSIEETTAAVGSIVQEIMA